MDFPASLGYRKEKLIKNLQKKYVTCLGFEPATSCVAIRYSKYLAIDQKEKLIKNGKKKRTAWDTNRRPSAGGLTNHLASDMSCEKMFNKDHIRKSGDSMKME